MLQNEDQPRISWELIAIAVAWITIFAVVWLARPAGAHEHEPGETSEQARVVEFYKTWHRPKGEFSIVHRQPMCCYGEGEKQDCFPVKARRTNEKGELEVMPDVTGAGTSAQIEYGEKWYTVKYGVEEEKQTDPRTSPDGRSHVCITHGDAGMVVCYVEGAGT